MSSVALYKESSKDSLQFQILTSELKKNQKIILIVEDNIEYGATLKLLLHSFVSKTVVMPTAEAGLEFLAEHSDEVILILSDINLPAMSGLKFIEKVRANSNFKQIPIIIQSSEDEEELKKGLLLGANDYVNKLHIKEALCPVIKKLFKLPKKENSCVKNKMI